MKSIRIRKPSADMQGWKRSYKQVEKAIHKEYVKLLRDRYDVEICHFVNEGDVPPQYRKLLLALGLRPGASDLIVFWKGKNVLLHEIKASHGSQSNSQIEFQTSVTSMGFDYVVTYGLDEAKRVPVNFCFPFKMVLRPIAT